jgi:polyhydroxyalkanoate synthase
MNELQRMADLAAYLAKDPVGQAKSGATPHVIIHRQNKAAVRYFAPKSGVAVRHPVFISVPLINTWTVFDLLPGKSVVGALVNAGVPVYLLDWGRPEAEDKDQTLVDIIDTILVRAFDRAGRHARAAGTLGHDEAMDAIGYCVGGTFLTIGLARHPGLARRLTLLATPIDFHASGRLACWAQPAHFPVDAVVDSLGNFPAEMMKDSFAWLKPASQGRKWKSLWERFDQPGFREVWSTMEKWSSDNVAFPGEAYREYVRRCYFDNALLKGGWVLGGRPVDLRGATIPALVLAADGDHIVPPPAAFGLKEAWGGPVETRTLSGGHVGVCLGSGLQKVLVEWTAR